VLPGSNYVLQNAFRATRQTLGGGASARPETDCLAAFIRFTLSPPI